jgi:hypothetical protein
MNAGQFDLIFLVRKRRGRGLRGRILQPRQTWIREVTEGEGESSSGTVGLRPLVALCLFFCTTLIVQILED